MARTVIDCGDGFWNLRGSFKLVGIVELGTHASLLRLSDGRFVILDSYSFSSDTLAEIDAITGGRDNVSAIINVHPFHTLHAEAMHRDFPNATHYGTARHLEKFPTLKWAETLTEDGTTSAEFAQDLQFSVPGGLDFISSNEHIHCSSVLVYHRSSRVIHVDDTFNYRPAKNGPGKLSVHPTLSFALKKESGAALAFREWGQALLRDWSDATRICAAHSGVLKASDLGTDTVAQAIETALAAAEKKLVKHARKYG